MSDSFGKKASQQKRAKKKKEKQERREHRKHDNNKGKDFQDMIAYVDEFGNITDVPPEEQEHQEIKLEDIQLGAAPIIPEEKVKTGIVTSYFEDKGYGFITQDGSGESVFVHSSNVEGELRERDHVSFEKERSPKGYAAIKVKIVKK